MELVHIIYVAEKYKCMVVNKIIIDIYTSYESGECDDPLPYSVTCMCMHVCMSNYVHSLFKFSFYTFRFVMVGGYLARFISRCY